MHRALNSFGICRVGRGFVKHHLEPLIVGLPEPLVEVHSWQHHSKGFGEGFLYRIGELHKGNFCLYFFQLNANRQATAFDEMRVA